MIEDKKLLPIENKVVAFAQRMSDISGKAWEVFRDGKGAVDCGLVGTCETAQKFKLLTIVYPSSLSHR